MTEGQFLVLAGAIPLGLYTTFVLIGHIIAASYAFIVVISIGVFLTIIHILMWVSRWDEERVSAHTPEEEKRLDKWERHLRDRDWAVMSQSCLPKKAKMWPYAQQEEFMKRQEEALKKEWAEYYKARKEYDKKKKAASRRRNRRRVQR